MPSSTGAPDAGTWLARLGVTDAPFTRAGVETALRFFRMRMAGLPEPERFAFLKGMDLHSPVSETTLSPPQEVAAFRTSGQHPLRLFYTKIGTSVHLLGVNPDARVFRRFRVLRPVVALQSRCAGARDTWSDPGQSPYVGAGGGLQLIIPHADTALEVIQ